jgi:hypothetical protein
MLAVNTAWAQLMISEVMAKNAVGGLADEDGDYADWLELYNAGNTGVDLAGYYLTDTIAVPLKWALPERVVPPGGFQVVFASGKDRLEGQLHTGFELAAGGESLWLVDSNSQVVHSISFPQQQVNVSFGVRQMLPGAAPDFLSEPTPGAVNPASASAFGLGPTVFPAGATFTNTLTINVTRRLPQSTLHYTVDGSPPTPASPTFSQGFTLSSSLRFRCREFVNGEAVGRISGENYLKLAADVVGFSSNLPLLVLDNFNQGRPTNGSLAAAQLFEPTGSGAVARAQLTDPPTLRSRSHIRVRGSSTSTDAKASLALEFRQEDDTDRKLPVLGMPTAADWVLNAPYLFDRTLMRNPLVYELSNAMGQYAVRTRQVEVFLNTDGGAITAADYVGVYTLMEKISQAEDRVDVENLSPQENDPSNLPGGYLFKLDRPDPGDTGFLAAGNQRFFLVEPKEDGISTPQLTWLTNHLNSMWASVNSQQFRDPAVGYPSFLDVPAALDHHILNTTVKNVDALRLSTYWSKSRYGKLKFGPVWDFDRSMDSLDPRDNNPETWRGETGDQGTDFFRHVLWGELFRDKNFWQRWIDRFVTLKRRGALQVGEIHQRIDRLAAELSEAAPRNFARWPDAPPRTSWAWEVAYLKTWLGERLDWMEQQFLPLPLSSGVAGNGGQVPANFSLQLNPAFTPPAGATLYYTTDGADPRVSESAVVWDAPLVTETTNHRALVPTVDLMSAWKLPSFDDSGWLAGSGGIGYDDETTFDPFIGTNLEPPTATMKGVMGSAYLRSSFSITASSLQNLGKLELRVRYDDAFVAWLNGTLVASGGSLPNLLAWNSQANGGHPDNSAVVPRAYDLSSFIPLLVPGQNVLAIQGLNFQLLSSDFLLQPVLLGATKVSDVRAGAQVYQGALALQNLPAQNGITEVFARYRAATPAVPPWPYTGSGSGLKPVGSEWGPPLQLTLYSDTVIPTPGSLRIAELLPSPRDSSSPEQAAGWGLRNAFEYVVLRNVSNQILDLAGVRLAGDLEVTIGAGKHSRLAPGQQVILVREPAAFIARYGNAHTIAASFFPQLPDANGSLQLLGATNVLLDSVSYGGAQQAAVSDHHSLIRLPSGAWRPSLDPGGELPNSLPQTYFDWQLRHFSVEDPDYGTLSDPMADPDHDGLNNWLEYALGSTPRRPNGFELKFTGTHIQLQRRPGTMDVNLVLRASSDAALWTNAGVFPATGPVAPDGTNTVAVPISASPGRQLYQVVASE